MCLLAGQRGGAVRRQPLVVCTKGRVVQHKRYSVTNSNMRTTHAMQPAYFCALLQRPKYPKHLRRVKTLKNPKTIPTREASVLSVEVLLPLLEQVAHNRPQAVDQVYVITPPGHVLLAVVSVTERVCEGKSVREIVCREKCVKSKRQSVLKEQEGRSLLYCFSVCRSE